MSGSFTTVLNSFTSGTLLEPRVTYGPTSVALELGQGSFAAFAGHAGLAPNQHAVAQALDSAAYDPRAAQLIAYLDDRLLAKLPGDFDRIAPEELTSVFTIGTSLAQVQAINVQRRTADLRSGANGFCAAGLAMNGSAPGYSGGFGVSGPTGAGGKESKAVFTPAPDNRWGVFLTGVGEWVNVGDTANAAGYDITTGGFTLGVDYKVCPGFAIGLNAGYSGTSADLSRNGRVWVNGGKLGLYATAYSGGLYADLAVSGGVNSYDTRLTALRGDARGSTDGSELNALFATGYDWKMGALTIGPTASIQYTYVSLDGFTERGSLAPLAIRSGHGESLRTTLGLKASYDWKIGRVLIRPEIRAAWQHESGDGAYDLTSSFASGAGGNFSVSGPQLGRDSALIGAGFAIQWSERLSTYLYYDGEIGRSEYDSHSISGGVRLEF